MAGGFDLLQAFGLDPGIIAILKEKYDPEILCLFNAGKDKRVFYLVITKLAEEKLDQFSEDYEKAGIRTVISSHDRREFHGRIKQNE